MPSRNAAVLTTLALAQLLIGLDYNIVYVALPEIAGLGFSEKTLQWVVSAYALSFGGLLLLCGRLTDVLGRRRMFLSGLALLAAGSLLGAAASTEGVLIAARAIQGLGGAALAPSTLALLSAGFAEGRTRNRALAVWGAAGSSGMVLGSILGGVLTETWGWRAVFAVNIPIIAFIVVLALRAVPPDNASPRIRGRLDLRRLGTRYLGIGTVSTFLFMASFGSTGYFLTLYLQQTRGLDTLTTGLAFVIPCVGVLIGTSLGGRLATRTGLRTAMLAGQGVGLAGTLLFAWLVRDATPLAVVLALTALFSLGQGMVFTTMFATATTKTPDSEQGTASGIATTGQQLGGAVGLALLVGLSAGQLTVAMLGISALIGVAAIAALGIPRASTPVPGP